MSDTQTPNGELVEKRTKGKELTNSARKSVVLTLQSMVKDGRLKHGSFTKVSATFGVSADAVRQIWKNFSHLGPNGQNIHESNFSRRCERGRKKLFVADDEFVERVKSLPVHHRRTIRDLAAALRVSRGTAHRLVQSGSLLRHESSLRPALDDTIKIDRKAALEEAHSDDGREGSSDRDASEGRRK